MAYTFDEVFANSAPPDQQTNPGVSVTLVTTQEDGRTACGFAGQALVDFNRGLIIQNDDGVYFNDRQFFNGRGDAVLLSISRVSDLTCHVSETLKAWGDATVELDISLPGHFNSLGKTYYGWGATIGGGRGKAIHCLSFHALKRIPVLG